jgi:hypothetical protein
MSDVRFMKSEAVIALSQPPYAVRRIDSVDYIEVTGTGGFLEASAVLADGQRIFRYMIMSDRLMYVRLSDVRDVRSLVVYGAAAAGEQESRLTLSIDPYGGVVEGIEQLRQRVVKVLLTTSGSSVFDEYGGGLTGAAGNNVSTANLSAEVLQRVRQVELQLTRADSEDPTRMLRSIDVLSITSVPPDGVRLSVRITNVAGQTTTTEV